MAKWGEYPKLKLEDFIAKHRGKNRGLVQAFDNRYWNEPRRNPYPGFPPMWQERLPAARLATVTKNNYRPTKASRKFNQVNTHGKQDSENTPQN